MDREPIVFGFPMANHQGANILIVDDEQLVRWSLENDLKEAGYHVGTASSGEEAIETIRASEPDLVLLDIVLPGMHGIDVLKEIRKSGATCIVIMLTALTDLSHAVEAIRAGAHDYIPKPFDLNDILLRVEKALSHKVLENEVNRYRSQQIQRRGLENIVAVSPPMQTIIETITTLAGQGTGTVLIRGESGVGKDLLASAIHALSPRAKEPFVEVNCPSFPPHLLENELFGHERGAFTDARTRKEGLLEIAHKGTVFLNEIGDVELPVQAKLLQFLEKKVFRRIGSTQERKVDVRVLVATNKNLEQAVRDGAFRQDLFYRLNVIPLDVPPLRERPEDIPVLIEHFLEQFRSEFSKPGLDIDPEAVSILTSYHWPGNVRELRNCLERMVLLSTGNRIARQSLPSEILSGRSSLTAAPAPVGPGGPHNAVQSEPDSPLVEQEKRMILRALEQSRWNQSKAARLLKISRDTLRYRIKKYGISTQGLPADPN